LFLLTKTIQKKKCCHLKKAKIKTQYKYIIETLENIIEIIEKLTKI